MPSISQKELDELRERNERQADEIGGLRIDHQLMANQLNANREILAKIVRAARARPILEVQQVNVGATTSANGYGFEPGWRYDPRDGRELSLPDPPSTQERQEQREADLHARLEEAQSRLASVVAIAEMGQEHRA